MQVCAGSGKLTCTVRAGADASLRAALFAHDPHFVQHTVEHRALTVSLYAAHQFIGCIVLSRSASATVFSTHEQAVLLSLAPALAAALHAQPTPPSNLYVPSQTGTLLLDDAGRVLHACPHAARLLSLATVDMPRTARSIDSLWAQLRAAQPTAGCDHTTTRGELHNACGQFVFHMQRLNASADSMRAGATLVTLTHYQPLALKILRQCEQLALPPKQTQIAVRLVHGESYDAIATQLAISAHTVIDHVRKLQTRLAVRNRSELVSKLVAG
ncbi:MAG: helix-turn-helix transcriptional regulator [Gammaproteobacteria bacterium]|nr:helix-turn-helix transcriptional regulator [Gammaproteobacteria bacterium]